MLGYDWIRLHAALNDFPPALLVAAVVFDVIGAAARRESLKAAGFWCLIGGVVGTALAVGSGLMAEGSAPHDEATHALMETHETFAFVSLGLFALLAVWRILRRGPLGRQEQTAFTTAGVVGLGLLIFTARLGGVLVFDHATGIDGHTLQRVIEERQGGHTHDESQEHAVPVTPPPESLRVFPDTSHSH